MIAVLDYGIGNLASAQKALVAAGADARLVSTAHDAHHADAVVLPGVGAFGACMQALRASGLDQVVHSAITSGLPFLGICVGLQMLFEGSEESPDVDGLGVIPGFVRRIQGDVKLPQMQWNQVEVHGDAALFDGLDDRSWFYFVHSYAAEATEHTVATCDYGGPVTAAVARDNIVATQFHPEKSSAAGLQLLQNFVKQVA